METNETRLRSRAGLVYERSFESISSHVKQCYLTLLKYSGTHLLLKPGRSIDRYRSNASSFIICFSSIQILQLQIRIRLSEIYLRYMFVIESRAKMFDRALLHSRPMSLNAYLCDEYLHPSRPPSRRRICVIAEGDWPSFYRVTHLVLRDVSGRFESTDHAAVPAIFKGAPLPRPFLISQRTQIPATNPKFIALHRSNRLFIMQIFVKTLTGKSKKPSSHFSEPY